MDTRKENDAFTPISEANPELNETDPLRGDESKTEVKRSFRGNCSVVLNNVTVEPTIFMFIVPVIITLMTTQNLNLEKACRVNLNFTDEICTSLKAQDIESQNTYEKEVQKLLAGIVPSRTYIAATLPCILAIFVGSWSDKTGHRKIFLISSISGQVLVCINNIINVFFFLELPLEAVVYGEAIFEGLAGGWCILFLTAFAYISSITTDETRTFRMGLMNFCMTVGFPVGMGLSGVVLKNFGYYGCYGMSACIHFTNLTYTLFVLKEAPRSKEQKKHDGKGLLHFIKAFFDLAHIKDTLLMVFKKTSDNRRLKLCILLGCVCLLFGPMFGEISVMYLSTRFRFNWDELQFSMFQTYNFITHTLGTIFSVLVFSKKLQWHDAILGVISTVSKVFASFVFCFAPTGRIFYIGPLVDILNGTSLLAIRSIFSKMVAPNELGKVNSIVALTENLMPLVYVPLYTKVYTATMETLPGAVFLMGGGMTIPAFFVFIWLFWDYRKSLRKPKLENGTELHMS